MLDLNKVTGRLKKSNLIILAARPSTGKTARQFKHKYSLDLIVIDYIQLKQGSKEYHGNRVEEVSEI